MNPPASAGGDVKLCLIEADYLVRQDALRRRNDLEAVMESLRRSETQATDSYVFGLRAGSQRGYAGRGFPQMFGSRSRAGWTYVSIAVVAVVSVILAS